MAGYAGSCYDAHAELWLMRQRWYDPSLGAWLTRDPLGYVDGLSLYRYVRGNPCIYFDPYGMYSVGEYWSDVKAGAAEFVDRLPNAAAGAAAGPASGAATGAAVGAGVGAVAGAGAGAAPGAAAGAAAGGLGGAISGFVSGMMASPDTPVTEVLKEATVEGAIDGIAGGVGGAFVKGAKYADKATDAVKQGDNLPIHVIDGKKLPSTAENVAHAQKAGHPSTLTRGQVSDGSNRKAALKDVPQADSIRSRDEYPFNSTQEGGAGSWVGHVPKSEQATHGGQLAEFYRKNNIQPGDQFHVRPEPPAGKCP